MERFFDDLRFQQNRGIIVTGERFSGRNKHVKSLRLPDKKPPSEMYETMKMRYRQVHDIYPVLREALTLSNYEKKFTTLVQLEEVEFDVNLKMYDMDNVTLTRKREFLVLVVPGLAEAAAVAAGRRLGHLPAARTGEHKVRGRDPRRGERRHLSQV